MSLLFYTAGNILCLIFLDIYSYIRLTERTDYKMRILRCKTNRIVNPLGFELGEPRLSWVVEEAKGKKQKWARIIIAGDSEMNEILYDSGELEEADPIAFKPEIKLEPRTRYYWSVQVCDDTGDTALSEPAWFETGLMDGEIAGEMITPCLPYDVCPYMRRSFDIDGEILSARAYFTGLGIYELYINGVKAGDEFLAPGCDKYSEWLQRQTYDVTGLLKKGRNTIGAIIGNGWAKGKFGFDGWPASYENNDKGGPSDIFTESYMLRGDLMIATDQGDKIISTDESWQSAPCPITFSSIYDGERYDAAKEIDGWCTDKADGYSWSGVKKFTGDIGRVTDRMSLPVKKMQEFKPELIVTPKGEYVLDVKQEISGWVEFKCLQPEGTEVRLQYGEILQDGCFYRDNLRSALAEYRFISDGKEHWLRPVTTFYGFRYVKVSGFEGGINPEDFTAWAIYSDLETTGNIETSNEKVNRLFQNCLWSQRDNFVDVPTDCPQRDERMGWTGDAQAFCPTANFNMDCLQFYKKYGRDLYIDQELTDGMVPHVTPLVARGNESLVKEGGACGWADAATVVPWITYLFTGDITILQNQFESMMAWAEWIYRHDEAHGGARLWHETTMHFGDWLALDGARSGFDPEAVIGGTDNTFLCSVYYYYSTTLVAKAAKALGKTELYHKYSTRAGEILEAIRREFFTSGGRCAADTQTGNAMSLHFGIAPEEHREKVLKRLLRLLKNNDMHLKTGFLGTPVLCLALSDNGANDAAYTLFLQEDLPSWLYEVGMGATTIWERWNSILPDGKISGTGMNSMNHYAYGAVIEWVYRKACGMNPVESAPGFREIDLTPMPDSRLGQIKAELNSPAGRYVSSWAYKGENVSYEFTIPFGAKASLRISTEGLKERTINGEKMGSGDTFSAILNAGNYIIK